MNPPAKPKNSDAEILPIQGGVYRLMSWLFSFYFRRGGWKIVGRENVPKSGAVIIAPNHASLLDPPLVGASTPRLVSTMAKAELFEKKSLPGRLFAWTIQRMGSFPVKRGAPDRRAIRRAIKILEAGGALVLFPEGTRTRNGALGAGELGLGMIAHAAKAPVVPVYLKGTGRAFSPLQPKFAFISVEVHFGKPLHFQDEYARRGDRETLQKISDRTMQEIKSLCDNAEKAAAEIRS